MLKYHWRSADPDREAHIAVISGGENVAGRNILVLFGPSIVTVIPAPTRPLRRDRIPGWRLPAGDGVDLHRQ
jgi:hypothetical protein